MKSRLITMIAVAAIAGAIPGLASAAGMKAGGTVPIVSEQAIMNGPVEPIGGDGGDNADALHVYLTEVCPTVLRSPGKYDAGLVTFCQEDRHG